MTGCIFHDTSSIVMNHFRLMLQIDYNVFFNSLIFSQNLDSPMISVTEDLPRMEPAIRRKTFLNILLSQRLHIKIIIVLHCKKT